MFNLFPVSNKLRLYLFLAVAGILSLLVCAPALPYSIELPETYPDPTNDIPWKSGVGFGGVDDIEAAFNYARSQEGGGLPTMDLPSQSAWNAMSDNEKALWLINSERLARGINRLHGYESNVTSVAQNYADWLLDNDAWGHYADGKNPAIRLGENIEIANCHDEYQLWMENLYALATTASSIPLPIERAIYGWMYVDKSSSWGHRYLLLYEGFVENGGPGDREGFMGIGRANGKPYTINSTTYPTAEVIVFNMFDPCSNWDYEAPPPSPGGFFLPLVYK